MIPELSFDGCGINGPDEYRIRLATFANPRGDDARKFGPLFAAAPDMLDMLKRILETVEMGESFADNPFYCGEVQILRNLIHFAESNRPLPRTHQ